MAQTILVVDDTAEIREIFRRVLTTAGFEVAEAGDGAEGVRLARERRPDLIIMDITLPVMDGLTAIRQLKADHTMAAIPVIVVSGDAFATHRARSAGGVLFLAKPVRLMDLLAAVRRTLAQAGTSSGDQLPRRQGGDATADTSRTTP